jgi:hypothetical protein
MTHVSTDEISEIERGLKLSRRSNISVFTFDWNYYVNRFCPSMIVFRFSSLNILFNKEHDDFSCLYWITKLHNNLHRGNTIDAYSFSRQSLTAVKDGIQSCWDKICSHNSFNRRWILKYWIFWIILNLVLFQKFLSQHDCIPSLTAVKLWLEKE